MKSTLARLEALEAATDPAADGPLTVFYNCTAETNPAPSVPRPGDTRLCLAPGERLPAWAEGRPTVFIPAELPAQDWAGPED